MFDLHTKGVTLKKMFLGCFIKSLSWNPKFCCIQFSRNFFGPILPLFWTPYKKIVILLQATKIFLNLFSMTIFTGKHLMHDQFGEKSNIVSLLFSFYLI